MLNASKRTFITAIIAKKGQTVIFDPCVIVNSVQMYFKCNFELVSS